MEKKISPLTSFAATYLAFECCLCTVLARDGSVVERPLYSQAFQCSSCGDTICKAHWMPCSRCLACCVELCTEGGPNGHKSGTL